MKLKLTGLAGTTLLLLSPITSAFTAITPVPVKADNNWDYDLEAPGLSEYDRLLQNAGPSDGIVDWHPTKDALSDHPTGQLLVKQLIDLSIATNDSSSNARKILFNDTMGNNIDESYKDKYGVALGFIAQILNFNNAKSGIGAKLEQAAEKGDGFDPEDSNGGAVLSGKILDDPTGKGLGHNISDILGSAFFGNADDAYAQIYLNGYDNVAQNEANIIRESTTSITIVAQSKSTGKKATAVFKLNNKTLPKTLNGYKLNNYVDGSLYALEKDNGNRDIAGLNLTTASQSVVNNLKITNNSVYWVDGNGDGTIVVPRGTTAKEIAKLISKKKLASNNSLKDTAPMKAVQGGDEAHSYEHKNQEISLNGNFDTLVNGAATIGHSMKGPDKDKSGFIEYNNLFNQSEGWFGHSNHMWDTNTEFRDNFTSKSASKVPNANELEASPFVKDPTSVEIQDYMKSNSDSGIQNAAVVKSSDDKSNIGKVGHLFSPTNYTKEAYDANHFVNGSSQLKDETEVAKSIVNSGSFSSTDTNSGVKKSFTYEAPVNSWLYKSYNNPYSTVVSSQGAERTNSNSLQGDTIKPQEAVDFNDPNNEKSDLNSDTRLELNPGTAQVVYTGEKTGTGRKIYYYVGSFDSNGTLKIPVKSQYLDGIDLIDSFSGKYGVVGTEGSLEDGDLGFINLDPQGYLSPAAFTTISSEIDNNVFGDGKSLSGRDEKLYPLVKEKKSKSQSMFFVQTWDKNVVSSTGATPLIYNNLAASANSVLGPGTIGNVDSPNFVSKYYIEGFIEINPNGTDKETSVKSYAVNYHAVQSSDSKKASYNSNLYNNPEGEFSKTGNHKNNSRFFVSQDFSVGPVSSDMVSKTGDSTVDSDPSKILETVVKNSDPSKNDDNKKVTDNGTDSAKAEFTAESGYKLVDLKDAAEKQGVSVDALAGEVAKVTGKSVDTVKSTKWLEASLPRIRENAGTVRINVVVYDKEAVAAPAKQDTKPSFSTTDVSSGNDPFNVNLRPYTTTYDDGAVLTNANVPQNFKNLLSRVLIAGNPDFVDASGKVSTNKLQQTLVSSFLGSWQQNDGSFKQTDAGVGVSSPLYMYGGFGISNSDSKNSYIQWPKGYTDNSGEYKDAINNFSGDFYRGGNDLKTVDGKSTIKGVPFTAVTADVSKLDITKAGTYPVVYTYTNPDNAKDTASITVPITVSDASAPVFAFQGSTDSTINVGDSFNEHEFKVVGSWSIFNNYGGDYSKLPNYEGIAKNGDGTPQVTVTGLVDTHTPGIYQLTYKATSISGASTTMIRNITVLPKEATTDWTITDMKAVGYINYVPGYGIMVYNAPAGGATGQRLAHATSWKISQKAVDGKGNLYYRVGKNQWINGKYATFSPINTMTRLNGEVTINYKKGYGVNLWKSASTTNGYYYGRKLKHGSKWKTSGKQNGFYKVGRDQWVQGEYAKYKAK
ncbi:immunoglobulin-like domain-containing protein [Xylocopilactobacillus apis]|uniref:Pesticidal crystal protein Cry22Aa Ig-like domain-containing protein n=1 Tax=Xylocopilactobacillus apis TaxID=2932183 RepID=A0AAU9D4W6_9LACO|nr:immunoglobulin-like domain-containing protein [Xylocopilactobacillus apis]BDR55862.1 hypothetical protein KIMC2_04240 [Xylocopilactobacillus apis]